MSKLSISLAQTQLYETLRLEIAKKANQIRDLVQQKEALERVLMEYRLQDEAVSRTDVTRKNSVKRVLIEGSILKYLQDSKIPIRAKALYRVARTVVPDLPDSTFRSHLHRMSAKGLIEHSNQGSWQATPVKEPSVLTPPNLKN